MRIGGADPVLPVEGKNSVEGDFQYDGEESPPLSPEVFSPPEFTPGDGPLASTARFPNFIQEFILTPRTSYNTPMMVPSTPQAGHTPASSVRGKLSPVELKVRNYGPFTSSVY